MLLFLGAGASKAFGIPDTLGFMTEFENIIGNEDIYKKLKESIPSDKLDMEVLMTILDDLSKPPDELKESMAPHTSNFILGLGAQSSYFMENKKVQATCSNMLTKIKTLIKEKCLTETYEHKEDIVETYDRFFGELKLKHTEALSGVSPMRYPSKLKIFTTNYDTCIEAYLHAKQLHVSDGTTTRYGELLLDVHQLVAKTTNWELVKLHGSINLFEEGRRIRVVHTPGAVDSTTRTDLGNLCGNEFIVYPVESSTPSKTSQSPLLEFLQVFRNRLETERPWVVIGSTFRDFTIASIMNDVLMQKRERDYPFVLHINPKATEVNSDLSKRGYGLLASVMQTLDAPFCGEDVVSGLGINLEP